MMDRISAIASHHDQQIIRALPKDDQLQVLERIILTHPCRDVVAFARREYLELTEPKPCSP